MSGFVRVLASPFLVIAVLWVIIAQYIAHDHQPWYVVGCAYLLAALHLIKGILRGGRWWYQKWDWEPTAKPVMARSED